MPAKVSGYYILEKSKKYSVFVHLVYVPRIGEKPGEGF